MRSRNNIGALLKFESYLHTHDSKEFEMLLNLGFEDVWESTTVRGSH